jgi:hypothetical protein
VTDANWKYLSFPEVAEVVFGRYYDTGTLNIKAFVKKGDVNFVHYVMHILKPEGLAGYYEIECKPIMWVKAKEFGAFFGEDKNRE